MEKIKKIDIHTRVTEFSQSAQSCLGAGCYKIVRENSVKLFGL